MPLPPFDKILFDNRALAQLGELPPEVQECLVQAFAHIKNRQLALDSPGSRDCPFVAKECQHTIYVSIDTGSNTVVVLDLLFDPDIFF